MPAADARLTNTIYPTPETFKDHSVPELLTAAGYGRVGVDKRFMQAILDRGEAAIPEIVRFASEPFQEEDTANLTRSLFLLLRHYRTPDALPFLFALVKANIEELPEELMEAVLEIGAPAVEPLLAIYDEIDDEDLRGELAFLLASFRNRDPRILERLLDHFEYDAADGIIILESFGDPAAIPTIQKIIAEPGLDDELRVELTGVVERLNEPAEASSNSGEETKFDLLEEFPDKAEPVYDVLTDYERLALLKSPWEDYRIGVIDNLIPEDVTGKVKDAIRSMALTDPSATLRGRAWEALAGDEDDTNIASELIAVLEDAAKPPEERSGALIGLATISGYKGINRAILDFYHAFPGERVRVVKAMWRTLDKTWTKYISEALASSDDDVREQAILGVGNLGMASEVDKLEALFDHERLRPAALYSYALAAPGQTSRARVKPMFNLIEKIADGLNDEETELVENALDARLAMRGLKPVFHLDDDHDHDHSDHEDHHHPPAAATPAVIPKVGRNDPCPCGSGKKYKKCHGQ